MKSIVSETSGTTLWTTRRHIPEDDTLQNHRCENLKSCIGDVLEVLRSGNFVSIIDMVHKIRLLIYKPVNLI
jgi:hypothetical protein